MIITLREFQIEWYTLEGKDRDRAIGSDFDTELSSDSIVQLAKVTLWFLLLY